MSTESADVTFRMIDGFQTVMALWAWGLVVLLHAAWRAVLGPERDRIRPSGPTR